MNRRTDRRVQYTLSVIEESLLTLLEQKPLHAVTVKALCMEADINRSTFYAHYKDIHDLLEGIQQRIMDDVEAMLDAFDYTKDDEALAMTTSLMRYLKENRRNSRIIFSDHGDPDFQRRVIYRVHHHLLQSFFRDHVKDTPINPDHLSTFVIHGSIAVVHNWVRNNMEESPEDIAWLIATVTSHGISAVELREP